MPFFACFGSFRLLLSLSLSLFLSALAISASFLRHTFARISLIGFVYVCACVCAFCFQKLLVPRAVALIAFCGKDVKDFKFVVMNGGGREGSIVAMAVAVVQLVKETRVESLQDK